MDAKGRKWFRGALGETELRALDAVISINGRPGVRLDTSALGAAGDVLLRIAASVAPTAQAVRVVGFDKRDELNWSLGWHQDRVVALRDRVDTPGFSAWTRKAGVWHAEPPFDFLKSMLFLRVHLDDADANNGPLEIALGSHRAGRVRSEDAAEVAGYRDRESCIAQRGDVLAASALILHRSGASRSSSPRRAVRIDYATEPLPAPLEWADASGRVSA
ncbi:MAG: phytanoyl-CoA dioxygenase family protein [Alphaproteobacteria bacterium]|nr:phytanoyl-CoA dioxygenase family protein [Alphaproteobacteria bacterium]